MKIKITHVLYAGLGGHFNVLKNLVESDDDQFFDVGVIFYGIELPRDEYIQFCKENGINYVYVKKTRGLDFSFVRRLAQEMTTLNPAYLFLHSSYPILAAMKAKKSLESMKIIIRETQAIHLKTKKELQHTKLGLIHADNIVFLSKEYANRTLAENLEVNPKLSTSIIPNGIEIPESNTYACRERSVPVVGMVSRIVEIKDHETLIRSIAALKKLGITIQLKIAGDGEHLPHLRKLSLDLGLSEYIEFAGMVKPNEINAFLQSLDVYVHASFGETMSNSIMQAQACGLPIIASDEDGINNVISNDENGLLVDCKNVDAHVAALRRLLEDNELRLKLSKASYAYAKQHLSRIRMFNAYKEICS